jgi:hypothetical protein
MKAYIGYDSREPRAYDVAVHSLLRHSPGVSVTALDERRLRDTGLLCRPTDTRGQRYDVISNAPASTEFAISRFLTPILAQSGWAMFADSDVVFLTDVRELVSAADPACALMCVKHESAEQSPWKMDGQVQTSYPRKNWSSVMLFNCDHPANKRLTLTDVQTRRGFDLHQFYWLADSEIGALSPEWNWLVGVQPKPANPKIAHFTLGGPFLPGWQETEHDEIWHDAERSARS